MTNYVNASLLPDEHIVYQGRRSIRASWLIIGFFGFWAFILGVASIMSDQAELMRYAALGCVFAAACPFIERRVTELAITNKRIIAKFGLISRQTIEINLHKVESVQVHQGVFGRLLNYGSIVISGAGNPQAPIPYIENPLEFRRQCMATLDSLGADKK